MKNYSDKVGNHRNNTEFENRRIQARADLISRLQVRNAGLNTLERAILRESGEEVLKFIADHLDLKYYFQSIILTTTVCSYIDDVNFDNVRAIINLEPSNYKKNQDKLLTAVNTLLPDAGIYIGLFDDYTYATGLGDSLANFGFEIIDLQTIRHSTYFVAIKTRESRA
jgi:hypothetical protein